MAFRAMLMGRNRRLSSRLVTKMDSSGRERILRMASWAVPEKTTTDIKTAALGEMPPTTAAAPKIAPHTSAAVMKGLVSTKP